MAKLHKIAEDISVYTVIKLRVRRPGVDSRGGYTFSVADATSSGNEGIVLQS